MPSPNLLIALVAPTLLFTVGWVLLRYGNYRRMPWQGQLFCLFWVGYLASRGVGSYLRAVAGRDQPWDVVTASLITASAIVGATLAEPLARAIKALLDSRVRERLLGSIFAGLPSTTILALAQGDNLRYQEFSNTFATLYGLFPRPGDSHYDLFPGLRQAIPAWADQVNAVLWRGEAINQEEPVAHPLKDGSEGFATYSLSPIRDTQQRSGEPPYLALLIWRDVTVVHRLRQEVERLVHRDDLTGLFNRRFFDERLTQSLAQQGRGNGPVSLLLIDLDHFGTINSSLGHLGGNAVLIEVGNRLSLCVRGGDTPVRWAGDEFAVICENTDSIAALKAARRIHGTLTKAPMVYQGQEIRIKACIGAATQEAGDAGSVESLWQRADLALYRAKDAGRNRAAGEPAAEAYLELEAQVAAAVEANEIRPWYQPIFNLQTGELVGAEALARWEQPDAIVYPGTFLPVVERSKALTFAFCESMLLQCCRQVAAWPTSPPWISFNLSQRTLERSDLMTWLNNCFNQTGVDPDRIAIETTERLSGDDPGLLETLLNVSFDDMIKSGMRLLLDDFGGAGGGTGIQLSWMVRALTPDATLGASARVLVKLDRRLIEDINNNEPQRRLTEGVINTIKGVRLAVIAEGVETQAEADCLRALGCDYVQGWLYDKALPAQEFERKYLNISLNQ